MKTAEKILWGLGGIAFLIGLVGLYQRWATGHTQAAYGTYVPWGLWVAMYIFLVGVASGAFMFATLDLLFNLPLFKGTGCTALWVSLVSLGMGLFQIWVDLGRPERIWRVYLQPDLLESVMAQIVWGYTLFGLLALIALALATRNPGSGWLKGLIIAGLPLSLFLSGGVGALLGVASSRPFWHVGLFPAQFPVFALASGAAVMLVVIGFFGDPHDERRGQQLWVLALATAALQVVKLYLLWADYSQSLYGGVPENVAAIREVLFGPYWWAFWIIQIGVGSLVPLVILVQPKLARHNGWAAWAGLFVLVGFAVARATILFPALTVPEFEELRMAYTGPGLNFTYFPTLTEWLLTLWTLAGGLLAFLVGYRFLLQRSSPASAAEPKPMQAGD